MVQNILTKGCRLICQIKNADLIAVSLASLKDLKNLLQKVVRAYAVGPILILSEFQLFRKPDFFSTTPMNLRQRNVIQFFDEISIIAWIRHNHWPLML